MYLTLKKFLLIIWSERFKNPFRMIGKVYMAYKRDGWSEILSRLDKKYYKLNISAFTDLDSSTKYLEWIQKNEKDIFKSKPLEFSPFISIVTPVYNTKIDYLKEMIESVLAQTYTKWELCIADDASTNIEVLEVLKYYAEKHNNIRVIFRKTNGHISKASNSALSLASGKYVAFLDHDDMLAPHALYEMVKKLNENKNIKLIYSDEDKIDENSNRFNPHFKSGWNPDMFFSQNYICHFVMISREIVKKIRGFRKGYEGSQDYDLLLRSLKYISDDEIDRVEKILYHWRAIEGSTAYESGEKAYAHQAGRKALQDYFASQNTEVDIEDGMLPNTYKVNYFIEKLENNAYPLVSIIIPTRDGYNILQKCVESIRQKTIYPNYEIIVVDNETTCPKTLDYFQKIKRYRNVRILEYHQPFNYSAINNYAVKQVNGELIALVNNDIEIISEGWLTTMVQHAIRSDIGAVGAKLYYSNETIQHAGVILGIGGVAGHSHKYFSRDSHGYFSRLKIIQNYSAVTGACLIVRKKVFEEVGGLDDENLKVAFNDVDFCLKLVEKGYRNLWTPYVELYHHESISRGKDDNQNKIQRFNKEVTYMQQRWYKILEEDSYYNINLTKTDENFTMSSLYKHEKRGENIHEKKTRIRNSRRKNSNFSRSTTC